MIDTLLPSLLPVVVMPQPGYQCRAIVPYVPHTPPVIHVPPPPREITPVRETVTVWLIWPQYNVQDVHYARNFEEIGRDIDGLLREVGLNEQIGIRKTLYWRDEFDPWAARNLIAYE